MVAFGICVSMIKSLSLDEKFPLKRMIALTIHFTDKPPNMTTDPNPKGQK